MKIKEAENKWPLLWSNFREALTRIFSSASGKKLTISLAVNAILILLIIAGSAIFFVSYTESGKEVIASVFIKMNIEPTTVSSAFEGLKTENIRIPGHAIQGLLATPDHISIDIKNNDFQNLSRQRDKALFQGIWGGTDQEIPASIRYRDETIEATVKLKGNSAEHWGTDAMSLKIKTNGDSRLFGMSEFSIQKPWARDYLMEWVFHRLLAKEYVPYLQMSFIDVEVNGKDMGIYTVEETPTDRLLDAKGYPAGPVFHLKEGIWDARAAGYSATNDTVSVNPILLYNKAKYNSGPANEEARKASDILEAYRVGALPANETFDIGPLARYWAISDLTGNWNGNTASNIRPYYNPVTSKLEFIGHDNAHFTPITSIFYFHHDPFSEPLFKDPDFLRQYVHALEQVSESGYLDRFFSDINEDFERNLSIIYKENMFYHFPRETFVQNQKIIRQTIYPFRCQYSYLTNVSVNGTVNIDAIAAQPMPVEVVGLRMNGKLLPRTGGPGILDGYRQGDPITYQTLAFQLPDGARGVNGTDNLTLDCRVYGTTPVRTEPVILKALLSDWPLGNDIVRRSPNPEQFSWLIKDEKNRTFTIQPGKWEIGQDLILPEGYTVTSSAGEGTRLDLTHGAMILSYSAFRIKGNENLPFEVTSSDGLGQGLVILNADNSSSFSYVRISNLSIPDRNGWRIPGSVTFYQSPIAIDHSEFMNGKANGSLLSIVSGNATVTRSRFEGSREDLVTIAYGSLGISGSQFLGSASSGITGTGSTIHIFGSVFSGPLGIGIRGMRTSTITIGSSYFSDVKVAGTAEDGSKVSITDSSINSSIIGLAAYQNTPGYGPGTIVSENVQFVNTGTSYLTEKGSSTIAGNSTVPASGTQVFQRITEIVGILA